MDGQRFDELTRTMAAGTSRRRVLRLAGGGLVGALLAITGGRARVRAEDLIPSPEIRGPVEGPPLFTNCLNGSKGPLIIQDPNDQLLVSRPCGGSLDGCPGDNICIALVNPKGQLLCRCVDVDGGPGQS